MSKFISNYAQLSDLVLKLSDGVNCYSRILSANQEYSDAIALMIYSPTTFPETVVVQVNRDPTATSADPNWVTLQSGPQGSTVDMSPPAAGKARIYSELVFSGAFRLYCAAGVAADRTFRINKVYTS